MKGPRDYGIIYNWDGAPHGYSEVPQSMDAFLDYVYAPLVDTQVGALFWCIGEHAARWPSDVLEQLGDIHDRRYERAAAYVHTENIRRMTERGEDPQAALIERGHEHDLAVYASVRMNDNHFEGAQLADLPTLHHTELTQLRVDHPEWLLGERTSEWFALSWDMSVPEVREHRLAHVREVCERYDWDGVELDWQRHAFHLPEREAWRLRYALTDLQRAIRQVTDELAAKRGRPFHVAARVSGSLEGCRRIGYAVQTWVAEGLVDILIPAGNAATDDSIEVGAFGALCEGTDVAVYPGFDSALPQPNVGPEETALKDRMRTRAIASGWHRAGADGIYVFNWHADATLRRELLTQIGSPETLAGTSKIYAATHRVLIDEGPWRGAYRGDRLLGDVPVPLRRTLTGDGPRIVLHVAEEVTSKATLRIRLDEWVSGDRVNVLLDGECVRMEASYDLAARPLPVGDMSTTAWLQARVEVEPGAHVVTVVLVQRHPQLACDLILTDVELVVGV